MLINCQNHSYVCKHTRVFQGFWETLSKRNKKCEICYNFSLWKTETIVDVKRQKQPPWSVRKISMKMFRKLNGFLLNSSFCSFKIFHWYLITDFFISKDFSFGFLISTSLIKMEAHFSGEHDRNLLTLYETMYVQRALRSKG